MCSGGRLAQAGPLWPVHLQEFSRASVQPGFEEGLAQRKPLLFDPALLPRGPLSFHYLSIFFPTIPQGERRWKQWKNEVTRSFSVLFPPEIKKERGKALCLWCVLNKTRKRGQDIRPHMAATDPEREAPCAGSHRWRFWSGGKSSFTKRPVSMVRFNVFPYRAGFGCQLWGREREEGSQNQDRQAWRYYQV